MALALVVDGGTEQVTVGSLPMERLEAEITELAGHLTAADCRFVLLVAEFDRREGWQQWECRSCAHWLAWRCGIELRAAREKVRVGRALADLPLMRAAFARGELSYSKVRALTRIARPDTESDLVGIAHHATATHIERLARAYRRCLSALDVAEELAAVNRRHARRFVRWHYDEEGFFVFSGRLTPEDGAAFVAALDAMAGRVPEDDTPPPKCSAEHHDRGCSAEHLPPVARTHADALMALVHRAVAGGGDDTDAGDGVHAEMSFHVDVDTLATDHGERCELDDGPALAAETARRLACDASVVEIVEDDDGVPLRANRRMRRASAALRRAVHARDRGCRFPGCTETRVVQRHHIHHYAHGGPTSLWNLIELCPFHHRVVHEGGWGIALAPDGTVTITKPDGTVFAAPPPAIDPGDGGIEARNAASGERVTVDTAVPAWCGDRLDLNHVLVALFHNPGGPLHEPYV
ncbi:MAG TPA: DUF222 domain-containing protein, partial [Acidimicrobiia bacterium]|nr:DUF222 domain-containing protein [Acidimicrobiia bacterium]